PRGPRSASSRLSVILMFPISTVLPRPCEVGRPPRHSRLLMPCRRRIALKPAHNPSDGAIHHKPYKSRRHEHDEENAVQMQSVPPRWRGAPVLFRLLTSLERLLDKRCDTTGICKRMSLNRIPLHRLSGRLVACREGRFFLPMQPSRGDEKPCYGCNDP